MTPEQAALLRQARDSLVGARLLETEGLHGFAASRAYYTMFYVAEAFLLGKGLAFSKHGAVHAAFGREFAKKGLVPRELHGYLLHAMEVRHAGDYDPFNPVGAAESAQQIARAEQFLDTAQRLIGPAPEDKA